MVVIDTHCHSLPYWFEPVEVFLTRSPRKAMLIQRQGMYGMNWVDCVLGVI